MTLPGKAELKFIEKELLADIPKVKDEDSLSDKDFDPRGEESPDRKVLFDIPSPIASDIFPGVRDQGITLILVLVISMKSFNYKSFYNINNFFFFRR